MPTQRKCTRDEHHNAKKRLPLIIKKYVPQESQDLDSTPTDKIFFKLGQSDFFQP
jgi:hypothetical protein